MSDIYYDWYGQPIPISELKDAGRGHDFKVAQTSVTPDASVSTVFLHGIDHQYPGGGVPLLFESLVFGGALDQLCRRYATVQEARTGHAQMVAEVETAETSLDAWGATPLVAAAVSVIERLRVPGLDDPPPYELVRERVRRSAGSS